MRNVLSPEIPPATFEENLTDLIDKQERARDALIALMPSAPATEKEWLDLMAKPEIVEKLGFVLALATKNANWIAATTSGILGLLEQQLRHMPELGAHFREGHLRAEMSCTCGQCPSCAARTEMGEERARKALRTAMGPVKAPSLIDAQGRPLN